MSNVLPFPAADKLWRSGWAVCRGCRHEWAATTDGDGLEIECPECRTAKATFKWPYGAREGEYAFVCACGCEDFFIMAKTENGTAAVYCRNCGEEKKEWWE